MKNNILSYIYAMVVLFIISCGQTSKKEDNSTSFDRDTIKAEKFIVESPSIPTHKYIDYIVFGRYCGECGGECATMYKLDILNNKLFVDHSDSYWKHMSNATAMKFIKEIHNKSKLILATQFLDSIPDFIYNSKKQKERFGCPDCTDGCGIFLEIKQDKAVKIFQIDYQTSSLTGEVKRFADNLKTIINEM